MKYRTLGKTGLAVSEVGFGGEWLERHETQKSVDLLRYAHEQGINIVDCWMSDPKSRDIIGAAMQGCRDEWIVQGHFGSTWQGGQYVRSRDLKEAVTAFEDLLRRMKTDYIDLGMIHYVDEQSDWDRIQGSAYLDELLRMKERGTVRHIGISTHNPRVAL